VIVKIDGELDLSCHGSPRKQLCQIAAFFFRLSKFYRDAACRTGDHPGKVGARTVFGGERKRPAGEPAGQEVYKLNGLEADLAAKEDKAGCAWCLGWISKSGKGARPGQTRVNEKRID
jgi:hypothetical protein